MTTTQTTEIKSNTVADIKTGDKVRSFHGSQLFLIGSPVTVDPNRYDGYYGVEIKAQGPFGSGTFYAPETPAYREESGCWTITVSGA